MNSCGWAGGCLPRGTLANMWEAAAAFPYQRTSIHRSRHALLVPARFLLKGTLVNMYWFLNVASIHNSLMSMVNTLPFEYLASWFPKS